MLIVLINYFICIIMALALLTSCNLFPGFYRAAWSTRLPRTSRRRHPGTKGKQEKTFDNAAEDLGKTLGPHMSSLFLRICCTAKVELTVVIHYHVL